MTTELTKDILQWDVKAWSKALKYWDKKVDWSNIKNGLELGGREGGLSLWLALKGVQVVCSDIENITERAKPLHARHQIKSLVVYEEIDATNIPYENYFDVIIFKSILGGIGRKDNSEKAQQLFDEIHKALKPGGKLLFAENLIASPLHQFLRKKFTDWRGYWHYYSINEIKQFLKKFSSADIQTTGFFGTFGRNEKQRNALSAIDRLLLNRLLPKNWKYVAYGIAEK